MYSFLVILDVFNKYIKNFYCSYFQNFIIRMEKILKLVEKLLFIVNGVKILVSTLKCFFKFLSYTGI